jgi:hypothetical protein
MIGHAILWYHFTCLHIREHNTHALYHHITTSRIQTSDIKWYRPPITVTSPHIIEQNAHERYHHITSHYHPISNDDNTHHTSSHEMNPYYIHYQNKTMICLSRHVTTTKLWYQIQAHRFTTHDMQTYDITTSDITRPCTRGSTCNIAQI